MKFDVEVWNNAGGENLMTENPRECMAQDIVQNGTFNGKSKEELSTIFGITPSEKKNKWEFIVREFWSTDIDPDKMVFLVIEFDSLNSVIDTYIRGE